MNQLAILTTGSEITTGQLVDANSAWLASKVSDAGFDVVECCSVPDDIDIIVTALQRLSSKCAIVIVTGGMGPTSDDLTREAVAQLLDVPLEFDVNAFDHMQQLFAARGIAMPALNRKQALFPQGATLIGNPWGTAAGFSVEHAHSKLFFLPGVPREMKNMFEATLLPEIAARASQNQSIVYLRTFGKTESQIAELLEQVTFARGVTIGYRATFPEIVVKIATRAEPDETLQDKATIAREHARSKLGPWVYAEGDQTLAQATLTALRDRGQSLAVAESCTGGLIASLLTEIAGSSQSFVGGAVVYSNAAKSAILDVDDDLLKAHGAVSAEVACAMAEGALRRFGAQVAISVTGIAGPDGASVEKPVGTTFFGLARAGQATQSKHVRFVWERKRNQIAAAWTALHWVLSNLRS